jgi:hypothetical protein
MCLTQRAFKGVSLEMLVRTLILDIARIPQHGFGQTGRCTLSSATASIL